MIGALYNLRLARVALVLSTLLVASCATLGPDYHEPEVKWLERWQSSAYPKTGQVQTPEAADLRFWWQRFGDATLNQLIETAKQDNPSLRIAGLRVLESRALLGMANSALYPQQQQVSGTVERVDTRRNDNSSHQMRTQVGATLGWELDFWGRFKRAIESADAAFFNSTANQQDAQVLISAQMAGLYFTYRITEARIAIAKKNVVIQKRSFDITERKYKNGESSELDFQQARTQYLNTLASIPQLELGLRNTRNAICVLLGRPPGDLPELAIEAYQLPDIDVSNAENIPAQLLVRRPDIRAAAWQIAAQSAQIGIAEADYYPSISLFGTLGWSGSSKDHIPNVSTFSIGPAIRWNIFDHGKIANNVRVQDARLQELIANYQSLVLQAALEVDDAATGVLKTAEQQTLLDESVEAAQRALQIANARYREGYADFQRVLDSQRALLVQEDKQLINRGNHIGAIVSLYKGLGGGWEVTDIQHLIPEETRATMRERSDWGNLLTAPLPDSPSTTTGASTHE